MELNRESAAVSTREILVTRIFDAPRSLVFKAWTAPEHMMRWFAPNGFAVPVCEMDFRVGGAYRLCMRGFDNDHWVHGVYKEIVEHERIVFTGTLENDGNEILTTVTFANHQGKTMLTVHQSFSLETDSSRGAHQGWSETLQRLDQYLASA
jgi:uncharacterized protein YndB with AHSA1/START domain